MAFGAPTSPPLAIGHAGEGGGQKASLPAPNIRAVKVRSNLANLEPTTPPPPANTFLDSLTRYQPIGVSQYYSRTHTYTAA